MLQNVEVSKSRWLTQIGHSAPRGLAEQFRNSQTQRYNLIAIRFELKWLLEKINSFVNSP